MKDVTEVRTSFCASSKITARNYSNKNITTKLIKERERISGRSWRMCVHLWNSTGAALYVSHCYLPSDFPNRRHKPILYRSAQQELDQHMKQNLYGYWAQKKKKNSLCQFVRSPGDSYYIKITEKLSMVKVTLLNNSHRQNLMLSICTVGTAIFFKQNWSTSTV